MVKTGGKHRLLMLMLLLWGGLQPALAEVEVTIDRNPVQVNESFQLVFSLDQSPDRAPDFSVLQQHFLVLRNNRSNSISIINGEYKRSVKWTLQLMPKQIGEFVIPAIRFGAESTEPFQVTVKPSALASVPHDQHLLEMIYDESETYVQSQVIVTLRLLSATDLSAYQFGEISTEGLDVVIEGLGDVRQYQTRIADRSYLVLEKRFALFPQQSGQLTIPPVLAEVRLPSGSLLDPFRKGGEILRFRSQPLVIDVAPVPAGFSGDYWLPADRVELREQWPGDLSALVAGEPVTRSLTLVADGLTAAQLPELELKAIDGIKQYPDQPVLENSHDDQGISARREQKVALIPSAAGVYRLPAISVDWWNRATGKMETTAIPARELQVAAAVGAVVDDTSITRAQAALPAEQAVAGNRFWLWMSLCLACGWALSAGYWWFASRRARPSLTADSEPPSLRKARRQLQQACAGNDAVTARAALLDWGRALLAPRRVANLHELAGLLGDELQLEVEALNQSLYAGGGVAWQGQSLWPLCQQLQKEQAPDPAATSELLTLNP
ncbi:MAG: protein BatD [Gammaproteobacteria bacterium]|nr:protein BatD [Gammaproteobacteria bacterium]